MTRVLYTAKISNNSSKVINNEKEVELGELDANNRHTLGCTTQCCNALESILLCYTSQGIISSVHFTKNGAALFRKH